MAERDIQHDIREALGLEPDLYLMRNSIGAGEIVPVRELQRVLDMLRHGKTIDAAGLLTNIMASARFASYGLPKGSADLVGILRSDFITTGGGTRIDTGPRGLFVAFEVKTATGRVSEEQTRWLALVRSFGGFAAVVRSVQEAKRALDRARRGESK